MRRNWKQILRRALTLALCLAALAGLAVFPAAPEAEALDMNINKAGFSVPSSDTTYMYIWHEGLPPIEWNYEQLQKEGKTAPASYKEYPVLITWDDKYFLNIDESFAKTFQERYSDDDHLWSYHKYGSFTGQTTTALFYLTVSDQCFNASKNGLLENLPFYSELNRTGAAVCLGEDVASLPTMVPASAFGRKEYLIGAPVIEGTMLDPTKLKAARGSWILEDDPEDANWLIPVVDVWASGNDNYYTDYGFGVLNGSAATVLGNDFVFNQRNEDWLPILSSDLKKAMEDKDSWFNKWYEMNTRYYEALAHYKRSNFTWGCVLPSDGKVCFQAENGVVEMMIAHKKHHPSDKNVQSYQNGVAGMAMWHDKSSFYVGYTEDTGDNLTKDNLTNKAKYQFKVYYAEPVLVSQMQSSFTVQKGQVVNLDGPVIIGDTCAVTVEDGGVLSCSGWVLNNGQILVKPGGTLIVQPMESSTVAAGYGAITCPNPDNEHTGGRIACDGTMILMSNCKVACAGLYGLELGAGAYVLNYGQIISENLTVKAGNTIENRGNTSAVFAGWGVTDTGYQLSRSTVSGESYPGKGTLQKTATVRLPQNAVYGDGKSRVYVNGTSSVRYSSPNPTKDLVSKFIMPTVKLQTYQRKLAQGRTTTVYYVNYGGFEYTWHSVAQHFSYASSDLPSGYPQTIPTYNVDLNGLKPPPNWPDVVTDKAVLVTPETDPPLRQPEAEPVVARINATP